MQTVCNTKRPVPSILPLLGNSLKLYCGWMQEKYLNYVCVFVVLLCRLDEKRSMAIKDPN